MTNMQRLVVGPTTVLAETGTGQASALSVLRNGSAEWELFYDEIYGFEFIPGFEYELEVRISGVEDPAQDASSLRYELVRVIERKPVTG